MLRMKQSLVLLLALLAFATAGVMPLYRQRRAANSTETPHCEPQTPCAWAVYKTATKIKELNFKNTYCVCGPELTCIATEDDTALSTFVYRCRTAEEAKLYHFDDS